MLKIRRHPAYPYILCLLILGIMILLTTQLGSMRHAMARGSPGTVDFSAYWSAGQLLRRGENPHDFSLLQTIEVGRVFSTPLALGMWNPPWVLIWLFPLFLLDFTTATLVWLGVNLAIVLVSSSLLWAVFKPGPARQKLTTAWLAGVAFVPALMTMRQGQISGLNLLGVAGFMFFLRKKRDLLAGASLALATTKPHTVYLLWLAVIWWVVTQRRWKVLAGCLGVLAFSGLALATMRPTWLTDYRVALANPPVYWATPTIGGAIRGLLGVQAPQVQYLAPGLAGLLLLLYLLRARPALDWQQAVSPLLLLSVATAAYAWTYDQIVLLVPYLQLIVWLSDEEDYSTLYAATIAGGIVTYLGILLIQNLLRVNGVYQFWTSWVLAGTYAYAWLYRNPPRSPALVRVTVRSTDPPS
ncbi:MAG: DUF2029 domain-containing protein [Chloroflexi bacterium]|nr:MAG: DUF2029 domain-containing protein [Chloroflexota bacterium]